MRASDVRIFAAILLLGSVIACSPTSAPPPAARSSEPAATAEPSTASAEVVQPVYVRGYYEARDGGLFTACGETSRRRVTAIDTDTAAALAAANKALDRPRFVMAEGNLSGGNAVEIGRFNVIAGDAWNCESRFDRLVLGARGSEVLWSLEVTPAAITLLPAPGAPAEVRAYAGLSSSSDAITVNAGTPDPEFSIRLEPATCVEAMTDTTYGWSISVRSKGRSLSGCAWRGLAGP
jgi:uncharacterized membrane protein